MIFIINTIALLFLGIIWNKSDWKNFFIKTMLIVLSMTNAFYALQVYGYIVKVI